MIDIKKATKDELITFATEKDISVNTSDKKEILIEKIEAALSTEENNSLSDVEKELVDGEAVSNTALDLSKEIMDYEGSEDLGGFEPVKVDEEVEEEEYTPSPIVDSQETIGKDSIIKRNAKNITEAIGTPASKMDSSISSLGRNLIPKKKDRRNIHNFILENSHLDRKSSEEEKIRQELAASQDANMQTILTGVVEGSRKYYLRNDDAYPTLFARVKYKNKYVEIRAEDILCIKNSEAKKNAIWNNSAKSRELLEKNTIDDREVIKAKNTAYVRALEHMLDKRYGSEVDFCVIYIDPNNYEYIVGHRHKAMEKKIDRYWKEKEHAVSKTKGGGITIKEGNIAEGRIVTVINSGIFVEVFGVESFIPNKELSYINLDDARKLFTVGHNIPVLIMRIDMDKDGEISFEGSYKKTMPNPLKKNFDQFLEGDVVTGTVTKINSSTQGDIGQIRFFVNVGNKVDIYCNLMPGIPQVPIVGDTVSLIVNGKDLDALRMWGCITKIQSFHNR